MKRLQEFLSEDSNQFGPGTDLIVSLLAVLLVMVLISSHLYSKEKKQNQMQNTGGNFKLAPASFYAGDFKVNPVTELINPERTRVSVKTIVQEYKREENKYPYIFVLGHSNLLDDPKASKKGDRDRLQRNWDYAGRRAAAIATLIQDYLSEKEKQNLIIVSTGEFDLKVPERPTSQENACVDVFFGKEWKPAELRKITQQ